MILTKHNTLKRLTIAAALLLSAWASQAQVVTRGTEFYLTFLPNVPLDSCKYFYLAATAEQNGTLIVDNPMGWADTVAIVSGSQNLHQLPSEQVLGGYQNRIPYGLHVRSSVPICLYACNRSKDSAAMDVALIYPVETLDQRYRVLLYQQDHISNEQGFYYVATQDNTQVTITRRYSDRHYSDTLRVTPPYIERMNRGEVAYHGSMGNWDYSTTTIEANKDIAVFVGSVTTSMCYNSYSVDITQLTRDHVYTQLLPTSAWGNEYVAISSMDGRPDNLKVMDDSPDSTLITFTDGAMAQNSITSTPRSLPYTRFMNSCPDMVITASNPIECVQSHASRRRNDGTSIWGDASTAALLPTNSFVKYARIPYFAMDSSNGCQPRYFINVVTHAEDTATIFLDSIPLHGFTAIGSTGYAYLRQEVSAAEHVLATCSSGGFGGHFYGTTLDGGYNSIFGGVRDTNIFADDAVSHPWDGTHDGRPCPQGAYVYRCRYHTPSLGFQNLVGTVTLLR